MQGGLLTVIVPVYRVEPYLRRCVDSIINQTYKDLEIILVDDGSPDNCPVICDEYAKQDSRVKVIHQKNAGVSAARNAGLDAATGDYIAFVDSDDWIELDAYEVALQKMNQEKLDLVAFGYVIEYLSWSDFHKIDGVNADYFIDNLMCGKEAPVVWRYIYKNSIFINLRFEEGILYEDNMIISDIYNKINSFGIISNCLYHYNCMNEQSIMHLDKTNVQNYILFKSYQKNAEYCKKHCRLPSYKVCLSQVYRLGLKCYICDLKNNYLLDGQKKEILMVADKINNLSGLDNIRIWDRIKYWSIRHSLFITKLIAHIQK